MNTDVEQWRAIALQNLPAFHDLVNRALSHVDLWQELKERVADSSLK